ncbi:MAG: mevalonate kinase [Polyangiaceae bacterium]|nr:mevalonate kinase [Polyangiaceae bacterium]
MTQRASACGKVILLGEHAVVYGTPAIAAGIERGAWAEVSLADVGPSTLEIGDRRAVADAQSEDDLARAFSALVGSDRAFSVRAHSELPPGGGLGSSAALAVSIARAIEMYTSAAPHERELRAAERALAWERVFHGNPSGIDMYAAANGGTFEFVRGRGGQPIEAGAELWLCIGLSGSGASTKTMVESVARQFQRRPELQARTLDGIGALVRNASLAIQVGDLVGLGRLMDLNQMMLAGLLLSTQPIEQLCTLARGAGALGAKLTGSGGGGSVIALVPAPGGSEDEGSDVAKAVLRAWKLAGFEGFVTRVGATGR